MKAHIKNIYISAALHYAVKTSGLFKKNKTLVEMVEMDKLNAIQMPMGHCFPA